MSALTLPSAKVDDRSARHHSITRLGGAVGLVVRHRIATDPESSRVS